MNEYEFNPIFEKWFEEHIEPTIENTSMIFVTKSIMEKAFIAGYETGVSGNERG